MSELVPCLVIPAFFIPLFVLIVVMRYISYRETLALAEKGLVRPPKRAGDGKDALRWGIAITAVGLALCMGLWPLGFLAGNPFPLGLGPWMLIGFVPTFFGLALILIFVLTYEREKPKNPPAANESANLPEA